MGRGGGGGSEGGWLLNLLFNRPTFSTDVSRSQRFVWSFRRAGKSDGCKWILDREDDLFNPADVRRPRVSKIKKKKIDKFARDRCQFEQPNTKYFFFSSSSFCSVVLYTMPWWLDGMYDIWRFLSFLLLFKKNHTCKIIRKMKRISLSRFNDSLLRIEVRVNKFINFYSNYLTRI